MRKVEGACRAAVSRAVDRPGMHFLCVLSLVFALLATGCRPPGVRALLKGKDLLEKGKCEQAVSELRTATVLLKTNAVAFSYLGLALHESGRFAEAEGAYHRALALNHELSEARYNLGCLYLEQNKIEPAKSEFIAFTLRRPEAPEGWIRLATAQLRSREAQAAERSFNQALRLKPQDPECLTGIGLARLQRNRPVEAVQWFRNALKVQPDYPPALLNLAVVAEENLRDKPLALQQYRLYLARKPARQDAAAVQKIAQRLEKELAPPVAIAPAPAPRPAPQTNSIGLAKTTFIEQPPAAPAARAPAHPVTNAAVAEKEVATNKPRSGAVEVAAKNSSSVSEPRSQPAAGSPKPAEPLAQPKPAPARVPETATPLQVVEVPEGQVFKAAQDVPARILPSSNTASATTNTKTQSLASAATKPPKRSLLSKINPARIFSSDDRAPTVAPSQPGRVASAEPRTESAEPLKPQTAPGQPPGARYQYLFPPKPKPGDRLAAERAYAQGVEAKRSRRTSEAIQAYQRATQLDPAYYDAYYNLGVLTAEDGELSQALSAYEHALAIEDRLDARYNFALALKQSNFPVDARNELEKLLAVYPNESRAHLALGNLYAQQFRDPVKAREHYLKVLAIDPQNAQASAIRYWLTENPPR